MTEDKTAEFFIELRSEEMPARMQEDAEKRFKDDISAKLQASGLFDDKGVGVEVWSTPRRLAVCFSEVRVIEPAREEEKRGPRADASAEAVNGFLRSAGITKKQAEIRQTSKGEFYFAVQKHKGRKAVDILPILIADVIANFKWPKSMRWGTGQKRWVRPLHGIVALFDGKALKGEVDFGGEQKIYLGNQTRGHRFLDDNNLVTITSGVDYEEIMKKHFVIVNTSKRRERIFNANNGVPISSALLVEVERLIEHPHVIQVKVDEEFLTLPEDIRIAAIETHQKFLYCRNINAEEIIPNFIVVADSSPNKRYADRNERIRIGAERVMRARLNDARFFLEEDEKTGLDAMRKRLDGMAFFDGLGTMGDKTERLIKLTRDYADLFGVDKGEIEKVARYAKADLASNIVNEFPTLQGGMGGYLARQEYGDTVATAIAGQYSAEENSGQAYYLSLMDMIDTLAAFVAIGKMPTGSKDPYALRRAGWLIVTIILRTEKSVPLGEIFYKALDYLEEDGVRLFESREKLYNNFISFLHDRARNVVAVYVLNPVSFNTVFHRDTADKDNIRYLYFLGLNLDKFIEKTEGIDFIAAYKRLANILDAEDKKDFEQRSNPEVSLFNDSAERSLYNAIKKAQDTISYARNSVDDATNPIPRPTGEIKALKSLTAPINTFLDAVRVNDEDPKIRQNRLNLLHLARTEIKKVAEFDKIQ